jgi:hypothetical protein
MKTRIIPMVLLIVCFSCGTNNKPVSDAQKEKIKREIKERVDVFLKGAEQVNFDMAMTPWLDSPDFVYVYNGVIFNYKEVLDAMKPLFTKMINQKVTLKDEKYAFLDVSTVIYTSNCTFLENYKDGHAVLEDPAVIQITFRKINDKWMAISGLESSVRQNVKNTEISNELNQVELERQFLGTWNAEAGKDTVITIEIKPYFNGGFVTNFKIETKGKIIMQEMTLMGYDKNTDKLIESAITSGTPDIILMAAWFTSKNKAIEVPLESISSPESAPLKWSFEFKSPDLVTWTEAVNNKEMKNYSLHRVKK